jgi:hypothetical protein
VMAGLTGERGCHDILQLSGQPRVTAIMRTWYRDCDRTGSQPCTVSVARTAHSTHHQ